MGNENLGNGKVDQKNSIGFESTSRLLFKAKKYNVMNKQTDTVALSSGY